MSETAPAPQSQSPTTADFLAEPLRLGEPTRHEALCVYPVFGPEPVGVYVSFAQGRAQGTNVTELEGGASVNDIVVNNLAPTPVLLFEGEEVLGAQQNRTFDVTALVGAGEKLRVPVSCVEAGRWQGSRHHEPFDAAPQTAYPELRRRKAERVRERLESGGPARADQGEVWENVAAKSARLNVSSPTGAMHHVYENHRGRLNELAEAINLSDGQSGALVAIGDRFVVLDWVSRPDVFSSLFGALMQGYALDALEAPTDESVDPPSSEEADAFLSLITGARTSRRDGIGMGREVRFAEGALVGTGLEVNDELLQLTVHNGEERSSRR